MHKDSDRPLSPPLTHSGEAGNQVSANALGSEAPCTVPDTAERSPLSRTLVHDLRNAVGPIRNAVYLLRFRSRDDPNLVQITDIIDRQVNEIVRLLHTP